MGGQWQRSWKGKAVGGRTMAKIMARESSWLDDNGDNYGKGEQLVGGK